MDHWRYSGDALTADIRGLFEAPTVNKDFPKPHLSVLGKGFVRVLNLRIYSQFVPLAKQVEKVLLLDKTVNAVYTEFYKARLKEELETLERMRDYDNDSIRECSLEVLYQGGQPLPIPDDLRDHMARLIGRMQLLPFSEIGTRYVKVKGTVRTEFEPVKVCKDLPHEYQSVPLNKTLHRLYTAIELMTNEVQNRRRRQLMLPPFLIRKTDVLCQKIARMSELATSITAQISSSGKKAFTMPKEFHDMVERTVSSTPTVVFK